MASATGFSIGQAAAASGVTAKMIRHYEALGLIPAVRRTAGNYRSYGEREVQMLRFIRRARSLGFSTAEITRLLSLWQNRRRSSRQVREIAARHIDDLDRRIAELQSMRRTLQSLVSACHADERPDCPILDDLALAGGAVDGGRT
ncbi:MAG: Cu(I)-responsive transcriptional regulator [Steroidobacteraceae bacterium]|nr:Cu(I)-responsive transcriptional regulator [Nevskiaceae bacterium]MCP5339949.1 Cu(I)-responsive transcriptional regulator [Nevskiaceae bacterium]MCP5471038.1 Cu(I)-responsive transcriptional regulator [Nevskiaceae bacterium]